MKTIFTLQKGSIFAVPILHYSMEFASHVRLAFEQIRPDCVCVELAETMQDELVKAAHRLPDISVVVAYDKKHHPIYYLSEPCDAAFEALRSAAEKGIPSFCIDLDVDFYPEVRENLPDPYALHRIGLEEYYNIYRKIGLAEKSRTELDNQRELFMAKKLKELSLKYDRILFVGGMAHVEKILELTERNTFPSIPHAERESVQLCTLTEESTRDIMAEWGWISSTYEELRKDHADHHDPLHLSFPPDRQKLIYQLFKSAADIYQHSSNVEFPGYNFRNIMKFARNYALISNRLMPDLFQVLTAAKACVEHNYAYEVWKLATDYPYRKNIDNLPELDLAIEDVWGQSKLIRFHLKAPGRKQFRFQPRNKDKGPFRFQPPGPFSICSYPPEDVVVENFGEFLKKKGTLLFSEEAARSVPFSTSMEDGLDTRETIRHWAERQLYVKVHGKPPGGVGSVVVVFDEDSPVDETPHKEKYPWRTTWLGEHEQESDMSFYATPMGRNVVGPGITKCEYGGFLMSYPPCRMYDIWSDPDYSECRTKAEALLMAAIDYAVKPIIVYVASKPPPSRMKSFAKRFGKKVVYIPIGQLSPLKMAKVRSFHVLDAHDKRDIADDYIF